MLRPSRQLVENAALPRGFYQTAGFGLLLYCLLAWADIHFTLQGTGGDPELEGNPLMRLMMQWLGPLPGLLVQKGMVGLLALGFTFVTAWGIHQQRPWVYYLAFFPFSRDWMQRKPRYWVAYSLLYLLALAQGMAALGWLYLIRTN